MAPANEGAGESVRATPLPRNGPSRVAASTRNAAKFGFQLASAALFFVGGFALALLSHPLGWIWGKRRAPEKTRKLIGALFAFFIRWNERLGILVFDGSGLAPLAGMRGTIIAPNHPGLLDAVFLLPGIPRAVCIMRASLMRNPSLGATARLAGYIASDRGPGFVRSCVKKLSLGENLIVFPEGTRTLPDADGVNPFKSGFALAAIKSGAPVQTVLIETRPRVLGKGSGLLGGRDLPVVITMRAGERFVPNSRETAKEFAARVETYFRGRIDNSPSSVRVR